MKQSFKLAPINWFGPMLLAIWSYTYLPLAHAVGLEDATSLVKNIMCKDQMTIDQALEHTVKSTSQRDIGWRSFQEDNYIDVERAILVSKAVELRYRWRVNDDGSVLATSDRAEKLCSAN
ncbi:hypothetical protein NP603_04680 [Methylomonas sp. SURF-1]|uniref:Secreted protein n=1 Tax=Methylomonas aurea TaxID=2952224 RepID=A0ABT1UFA5_9GAMM|nr:hypothetical protein [Methylomonas sp. SURF-1]MCQ8180394.1 hypothetical protein [Methylomonas sp. SURF-1]